MVDSDVPPTDSLPELTDVVPIYEELVELAEEHLQRPVSTKINTWEDGTYRVIVFHQRRPDVRETLYYHSDESVIRYGVEGDEELREEQVITEME